mgnify:CR=1 FL=1
MLTLFALSASSGGTTHNDYNIAGTESQAGIEFLRANLPHMSGTEARVVVRDSKQFDLDDLEDLRSRLADMPGAAVVSPPRMSADGDTALITVQYDIPVTDFNGSEASTRCALAPWPGSATRLRPSGYSRRSCRRPGRGERPTWSGARCACSAKSRRTC